MKKKLTMVVSLLLVMALSIGGTLAYLTDKTEAVTNTFTVGKVDISLTETGATDNAKSYHIVPGAVYAKDPTITVTADSEDCWLFVKIEDKNNDAGEGAKYINYDVRGEWKVLDAANQIYYREVKKADSVKTFYVLTGGTATDTTTDGTNGIVTANGTAITSDYVAALAAGSKTAPQLIFTAYAIQQQSFTTAEAAWAEVSK